MTDRDFNKRGKVNPSMIQAIPSDLPKFDFGYSRSSSSTSEDMRWWYGLSPQRKLALLAIDKDKLCELDQFLDDLADRTCGELFSEMAKHRDKPE